MLVFFPSEMKSVSNHRNWLQEESCSKQGQLFSTSGQENKYSALTVVRKTRSEGELSSRYNNKAPKQIANWGPYQHWKPFRSGWANIWQEWYKPRLFLLGQGNWARWLSSSWNTFWFMHQGTERWRVIHTHSLTWVPRDLLCHPSVVTPGLSVPYLERSLDSHPYKTTGSAKSTVRINTFLWL